MEIPADGEAEPVPVPVRLGVWVSNTKSRRDKLTAEQLAALAKLGMQWAGPPPAVVAEAAQPIAAQTAPRQRKHHDECDKALYEGGTCTYDLIEQYGPPSEHDDY
ncbi:helicase associated domain-containing protein [Streptomyces decoyicus]|uniref:helicase associated domain-containing protein n=1 Tax=Streptomyces decoyicus TaxID=249567 RepID=UPI003C12B5F0